MFPAIAPKSYSILLAEDLLLVLEGLSAWCQAQVGYHVVAQCCEGISALRLIECDKPDIAILDLNLRDLSTFEIVRKLRDAQTQTRIVILSTRNDERIVVEALRSGANAFLLKSDPTNHLLEVFDQILGGGIYISPSFKIDNIFISGQKPIPENPLRTLSPRESQVLMAGRGHSRQRNRCATRLERQDRGHLPRQYDAQAGHQQCRWIGKVGH